MVLPKTTFHLSRFTSTALKTFTHGYAQTVVAASQSYTNQNSPTSTHASGIANRAQLKHRHGLQDDRSAKSAAGFNGLHTLAATKTGSGIHQGLAHRPDVHKSQRREVDEAPAVHIVKLVGWDSSIPALATPTKPDCDRVEHDLDHVPTPTHASTIRRSYSTSAVDDFAKGIPDSAAEAVAHAQVNHAIVQVAQFEEDKIVSSHGLERPLPNPVASLDVHRVSPAASRPNSPPWVEAPVVESQPALEHRKTAPVTDTKEGSFSADLSTDPHSYTSFLHAAMQSSPTRSDAAAKAFEILAQMVQHNVAPSLNTVNTMLDLFSERALYASRTGQQLLEKTRGSSLLADKVVELTTSEAQALSKLAQDKSLDISLQLVHNMTNGSVLSKIVLERLIVTCSVHGRVSDMSDMYRVLVEQGSAPSTAIFVPMIAAHSTTGDLQTVVATYGDYRKLAMAHDAGAVSMDRIDNDVYAAVIKAYATCDRVPAGKRFFERILASLPDAQMQHVLSAAVFEQAIWPLLAIAPEPTSQTKLMSIMAVKPVVVSALSTVNANARPELSANGHAVHFDPYAMTTDYKASAAIVECLDAAKPTARPLAHAMSHFRRVRSEGRHPRASAYAKLISAAAKEHNFDAASEVYAAAETDMPFVPQNSIARLSWVNMTDAMLATCINLGRQALIAQYHQKLIDMAATPSANTYGLLIANLKEGSKSSDEASEALKIFMQAESEGVTPTPFLYNALIGKLGKARRIDDCLYYLAEMRRRGIRPTSVTYGTIVNALCRVSDERFAEEMFEEMESCTNYKPRPAPYHSMMQHFLTTKRDRSKVLAYYDRMCARGITPTMHTFKLLIDAHATIEPVDMHAAESVLRNMRQAGQRPEAVHYSSLIHAKGCVLHDMQGAMDLYQELLRDGYIRLEACIFQAVLESLVANDQCQDLQAIVNAMQARSIAITPYIANALLHGWTLAKNLGKVKYAFALIRMRDREPSTYEAMIVACVKLDDMVTARSVAREATQRAYPPAVEAKILDALTKLS